MLVDREIELIHTPKIPRFTQNMSALPFPRPRHVFSRHRFDGTHPWWVHLDGAAFRLDGVTFYHRDDRGWFYALRDGPAQGPSIWPMGKGRWLRKYGHLPAPAELMEMLDPPVRLPIPTDWVAKRRAEF